jgi:hypothetical protein
MDELRAKALWGLLEELTGSTKPLQVEHDNAITQMLEVQKKAALLQLICTSDLEKLLPQLLGTKEAQHVFALFLKTQYNSAHLKKLQIGTKQELNQIKRLVRDVFEFCCQEEKYADFIRYFLEVTIVKAGVTGVADMRAAKASTVLGYFESEKKAIEGCNPVLMKFVVKHLMKHAAENEKYRALLFEPNLLSSVFSISVCEVFILQKD